MGEDISKIGFYTLSDDRAKTASETSALSRCELILTGRCNFKCPYCRGVGGFDIPGGQAKRIVDMWADNGLQAIRFSGGEPTLYGGLNELVEMARMRKVGRIALSTNGSANADKYMSLIDSGVNDFSTSLDACCAEDGDFMAGGRPGSFEVVVKNIELLSKISYVTVGVVLTNENVKKTENIIEFAHSLGVSDIRVIPAAQNGQKLSPFQVPAAFLDKYPILAYRERNLRVGRQVRGNPTKKCGLVLDDMAVMGDKHYPCIIYMREGGQPIGEISRGMRVERKKWYETHDCTSDPICSRNCLDVCVDYNTRYSDFH
jgi:sulfatase maturation enzyme AslB (radical SAM superfamily)